MPKKFFRKKNKRYSKKRYSRYRPWYNRVSIGDVARSAYQGVQYIKGMINVEKHYLDTSISVSTIPSTGTVTLLSGVAQGDDVNNRQGNSLLAKTLYGRFTLARDGANGSVINSVRMIILKDLENTGSAPAVSDVLSSVSVVSPLNVDHTSRYQILMDKVYTLDQYGTNGLNSKKFITINDHLKFTGSAGTDVYKNALYLIMISDQGSEPPTTLQNWRLGFYDN